MKRFILGTFIFFAITTLVMAGSDRLKTPMVRYIEPKDESVVDLRGKDGLTFSWKATPIPAGGRMAYRFELFKGWGYERIVNETLDRQVCSIKVSKDKFEDKELYTWQVKQRDADTRLWGLDHRWSFTVKK